MSTLHCPVCCTDGNVVANAITRRRLYSSVGGIYTSTPGGTSEDSTTPRRYNVGVFGAGRIASSVHLKNILKKRRLDLRWVVDDSPASVANCRDSLQLHDVPFHSSGDRDALLNDESLDAVFVFTPTNTHADLICSSLNKGKSVMTEKPCGETYEDIRRCYETAERVNKHLLTGFQRL